MHVYRSAPVKIESIGAVEGKGMKEEEV